MNKKIDTTRYVLTDPAQVGADIVLADSEYTDANGDRITEASTAQYTAKRAAEVRRGGRPSLATGTSPQIAFRIPAELRERAAAIAAREGRTVSAIAREQLERYIAGHDHTGEGRPHP